MNHFNPVHALTTLQMEILLIMRTYYNNNQKWNWPTKEEPVFHHLSNGNQFSILVTFFCYYYCSVPSLLLFSSNYFFHQNTLK